MNNINMVFLILLWIANDGIFVVKKTIHLLVLNQYVSVRSEPIIIMMKKKEMKSVPHLKTKAMN
ncbi:hypothetical protein A6D83_26865 [Klebsiella pneumoniae]|nr:hypothetical protein AOD72_04130 [Klebsiella pneumoniae subsp. pneumoniae]AVR39737.1 hypothetical protein KPC142_03695 [Klebsiella quasipneumoniae]OCU42139.1 hypothetical protein A6D83_26865 [Klebsiella pneumoniae]OLR03501.1 hypothetical protein BKY57_15415 [Klebsiella pneumoniae]